MKIALLLDEALLIWKVILTAKAQWTYGDESFVAAPQL
jgi:hypothetical protein